MNYRYNLLKASIDTVENQIKIYKMMYNNSDSELLSAIQNAGYKDLAEFEDTVLLSYKKKQASKDYVRQNMSEDKIKKYYDENVYGDITVSHILINVDITDTMTDEEKEEAQKKMDDKIIYFI